MNLLSEIVMQLWAEENNGGIVIPDCLLSYIVIKTTAPARKLPCRPIEKMEVPNISAGSYNYLIFDKDIKTMHQRKDSVFS